MKIASVVGARPNLLNYHQFIKSLVLFQTTMPEEINRLLTVHLSDYLFAPTQIAIKNLENTYLTKYFIHKT